jgi:hypothetical protein
MTDVQQAVPVAGEVSPTLSARLRISARHALEGNWGSQTAVRLHEAADAIDALSRLTEPARKADRSGEGEIGEADYAFDINGDLETDQAEPRTIEKDPFDWPATSSRLYMGTFDRRDQSEFKMHVGLWDAEGMSKNWPEVPNLRNTHAALNTPTTEEMGQGVDHLAGAGKPINPTHTREAALREALEPFARPTLLSGREDEDQTLLMPMRPRHIRCIQQYLGVRPTYPKQPVASIACPKCGSLEVMVARDMKATRRCTACHNSWLPSQDTAALSAGSAQ